MSIHEQIHQLRSHFLNELREIQALKDLEMLKVKYLGKKGPLQELMRQLKDATPAERPLLGQSVNSLKEELQSHCESYLLRLKEEEMQVQFEKEKLDSTLPGRLKDTGRLHPLTQAMDQALAVLENMGFSIQLGPDIETDFYNFEGLNFPENHPARDMQDTFYLEDSRWLLRTHTSNVQVHMMQNQVPPIRVAAPGRCFRNETISSRSHVFFHQIEAFYIDRHVTFADLLATMREFWSKLLGKEIKTRFRPSFFPFVEPGVEVDVHCTACNGEGCRLCKHTGWLEVCGAGMIHPNVLTQGNIDSETYSGYAWGMGIERFAILQGAIPDIRLFAQNDLRFLRQFS